MSSTYQMYRVQEIDNTTALQPTRSSFSWRFRTSWSNGESSFQYPDHKNQLERFRWYLEKHASDEPLEKRKSAQIGKELNDYGKKLGESLPRISNASLLSFLDIYDCGDKSSSHSIPWELLENSKYMQERPLIVRRRVIGADSNPTMTPAPKPTPKIFNLLLIAARRKGDKEEYRQAALPILRLIQNLPDGASIVSLEIVRPGKYQALIEHLAHARSREHQFHLIHFDVHGGVDAKHGARLFFSDRKVPAGSVAKLLKTYGVQFAVLNACESARADMGLKANLAKNFVQEGMVAVLAMSYQLNVSAVTLFTHQFYESLFCHHLSWTRAASAARKVMHANARRKGRYGLEVDIPDWIVPVAYSSMDGDYLVEASEKILRIKRPVFPALANDSDKLGADLIGRDADILEIEETLIDNARNGMGRLLLMDGDMGVGKTSLLQHLERWWVSTGMVTSPVYVDLEEHRDKSPEEVCEKILRNLGRMGRTEVDSLHKAIDRLREYLLDLLGPAEDSAYVYPRPLLIFDHLWSKEWPRSLLRDDFWGKWKIFFESLSRGPAYTIVASHRWPWYLDDHHTSEFNSKTIISLGPLRLNRTHLALKIGGDYKIDHFLTSRKDMEDLDMILEWCAPDPRLLEVYLPFVREIGVEKAAMILTMGEDVLSYPGFRADLLKQFPAYHVAKNFWKNSPRSFKEVLIGFAPFLQYLPRCHELYYKNFAINKSALLNSFRKCLGKYIHQAFRKKYSLLLPTGLLAILKTMGLIKAAMMLGPIPAQSRPQSSHIQQVLEGTKTNSIHPVFTLFLRHKAKKAGFLPSPGNRKHATKSMCLEKTFVDYHESRVLEWFDQLSANANGWDAFVEMDQCKISFIAAMEIKLRSPLKIFSDRSPIPAFLCWGWTVANGDVVAMHPMSGEYLATTSARALAKCRNEMFGMLSRPGWMFHVAPMALEGLQLCLWLALHSLQNGRRDRFAMYLLGAEELMNLAQPHLPPGALDSPELGQTVILLDALKCIRDDTNCSEWTVLARLPVENVEVGNSDSLRYSNIIQKSLPIVEHFWRVRGKSIALEFWNAEEYNAQIDMLNIDADNFLTELAPIWPNFLSALDSEMLFKLRVAGFNDEDDGVRIPDSFWDEAIEDLREFEAVPPPNYSSVFMAALRNETSIEAARNDFEQRWNGWIKLNARQFVQFMLEVYLDLDEEISRSISELSQISTLSLLNDWPLLFDHLDSLMARERILPLHDLNVKQLARVAWWHINKGYCALRMSAWAICLDHITEVLGMVSQRSDFPPAQHLHTLMLQLLLQSNARQSMIHEITTPEIIYQALLIGYAEGSEGVYARNGALLSLLLCSSPTGYVVVQGEASKDGMKCKCGGALRREIHAQIEYTLSTRMRSTVDLKTTDKIAAIRNVQSNQTTFPLSTAFCHHLFQSIKDSNVVDARPILAEAENHLFSHPLQCECLFKETKISEGVSQEELAWEIDMPVFDLEFIMSYAHHPRLGSMFDLMKLWVQHRFGPPPKGLTVDERNLQRLQYLGQWHEAARDPIPSHPEVLHPRPTEVSSETKLAFERAVARNRMLLSRGVEDA